MRLKMKKIKVYLQKPWRFSDSSYYKYIVKYPPKNVEFLNVKGDEGAVSDAKKMVFLHALKRNIRKILTPFSVPNAHLTRFRGKYDLIHCAHCLSLNKRKPWVMDIEYLGQLWISNKPLKKSHEHQKWLVKKILLKNNCKKIITWTNWVKKDLIKMFPEIKDKIEILPFAMPAPKFKKNKKNTITLLFISRRFYFKSGLYAIEVIDHLTKKYESVEGIVVSETPKEIINKYGKNKKIKFYDLMPQEELFKKIYPNADIFIYPAYTDTYGFGYVEAMAFGLPIMGVKGHCNEEIIENNQTGFLIEKTNEFDLYDLTNHKDIIKKLIGKTEILIKNKKLREKISKAGIKEVAEGKFSIKKRNKKLKKIYEEALK